MSTISEITLEQRLTQFKEEFESKINKLTGEIIDSYTEIHFADDMPVSELIELITLITSVHTDLMMKNILTMVAFYKNPNIGQAHITSIQAVFDQSMESIKDLEEQLVALLEQSTTTALIH